MRRMKIVAMLCMLAFLLSACGVAGGPSNEPGSAPAGSRPEVQSAGRSRSNSSEPVSSSSSGEPVSSSSASSSDSSRSSGGDVQVSAGDGVYEGTIGTHMMTYFFDFWVRGAEAVDSFAGYEPGAGYRLIVIEIETYNSFGSDIEMYDWDYELQWDVRTNPDTYSVVLDALDDTCAPLSYELAAGETMQYYYVYEAPEDVTDFELCYLEEFSDDTSGDIYYVQFSV